jgi:hypothetical protein
MPNDLSEATKKRRNRTPAVFNRVGLLTNESPGRAALYLVVRRLRLRPLYAAAPFVGTEKLFQQIVLARHIGARCLLIDGSFITASPILTTSTTSSRCPSTSRPRLNKAMKNQMRTAASFKIPGSGRKRK